ncbi:MAG: hypothetical protein IJW49_04215 [Clostridia bacterium]|nr:hypothetical protein [Clostridia bacterium]
MKKIVSILLIVCMLLSVSAMLSSCKHTCEFSEDWTKDETSHWHACTDAECAEIADKAEHVWDEGQITTKATQEAAGVKTFTCTTCGQTKTEAVVFTGFTEEEWEAALADSLFENFTYEEEAITILGGKSSAKYKFTKDDAWVRMVQGTSVQEEYASSLVEVEELRGSFLDSLEDMTPYDSFKYDAETKTYKAETIYLPLLELPANRITVTFSEGKLTEISYEVNYSVNGVAFDINSKITISDYGTTTITR